MKNTNIISESMKKNKKKIIQEVIKMFIVRDTKLQEKTYGNEINLIGIGIFGVYHLIAGDTIILCDNIEEIREA